MVLDVADEDVEVVRDERGVDEVVGVTAGTFGEVVEGMMGVVAAVIPAGGTTRDAFTTV